MISLKGLQKSALLKPLANLHIPRKSESYFPIEPLVHGGSPSTLIRFRRPK